AFISFLEGDGHYARGEKMLMAQLQHPIHDEQRRWLDHRLHEPYARPLDYSRDGSLGQALSLYQSPNPPLQKGLAQADHNQRQRSILLLMQTYRVANGKRLAGVAGDLRDFAFKVLPGLLKQQTNNDESLIGNVAFTVRDLIGARDGIVFLLNTI